uniref:Olfactory receptor n=1 Tax=Denticeps clupeoides TaxID=299321 RepID=A0AAY4EK48_9TELE
LSGNRTTITQFIIVGFPGLQAEYYGLVSMSLFMIYITTVVGNSLLLLLYVREQSLKKPMYIIMLSLALSDIGFCTVALPKIIAKYWFNSGATPFHVCFMQKQLIHYFGTLNSLIMMIMALDRYVAICYPFRYPVLITSRMVSLLNIVAWVVAMVAPTITTVHAYQLPYCGPNLIVHCYCDQISITNLACADHSLQRMVAVAVALFVLLFPLSFIVYTYTQIIVTVVRIANMQGRLKMFSTCSAQLSIIVIYFVPRSFVYLASLINIKMSTDFRIILILFYSLFPPLINPFIYCIRTKEIRQVLAKWLRRQQPVEETTTQKPIAAIAT